MKIFKLFSLFLISGLFAGLFFSNSALAQTNDNLANALAEYEADEIDAPALGTSDPLVLPGDGGYWWQNLKENVGLFFTFNQEKKAEKLQEIASRRLLEAKKLAEIGTDNAATRIEDALAKYQIRMEELSQKLKDNPNISEDILTKFDTNQLRHQQILSDVAEKLRNKAPNKTIDEIQKIKDENALNWYNTNPDQIQQRLENSIQNNDLGSKFKQLRNIATLEELKNVLPEEAGDKITAAKEIAEERLNQKLENLDRQDQEKIEKYINNIKTTEVVKQKFISNLKDSPNLSAQTRQTIANSFERYNSQLRTRFESLSDEEKEKFLDQFENKLRSHPANLEFLQGLDMPQFKERIQNLIEIQQEGLKEKIQSTTDPVKLRTLEQNLREYPVLRKEIQERQKMMPTKPNLNIRSYQAQPTDSNQ
ncbi:hypothetical protein KKH39_02725 [Patescibacteria group bacterium]|nr:hypothetical protein [Patescibacteria group bacterium]